MSVEYTGNKLYIYPEIYPVTEFLDSMITYDENAGQRYIILDSSNQDHVNANVYPILLGILQFKIPLDSLCGSYTSYSDKTFEDLLNDGLLSSGISLLVRVESSGGYVEGTYSISSAEASTSDDGRFILGNYVVPIPISSSGWELSATKLYEKHIGGFYDINSSWNGGSLGNEGDPLDSIAFYDDDNEQISNEIRLNIGGHAKYWGSPGSANIPNSGSGLMINDILKSTNSNYDGQYAEDFIKDQIRSQSITVKVRLDRGYGSDREDSGYTIYSFAYPLESLELSSAVKSIQCDNWTYCEHSWETTETKNATCTEDGYTIQHCTTEGGCNETRTITTPALGHSLETINAKSATCTGEGNVKYYRCIRCDNLFLDSGATTSATEDDVVIFALGHDYSNEWTVDKEATCKEEGSKSHHCTRCDAKTDITVIPKLDHTFGDWIIDVDPTATADGHKYRNCNVCNYYEEVTIPATGNKKLIEIGDNLSGATLYVDFDAMGDVSSDLSVVKIKCDNGSELILGKVDSETNTKLKVISSINGNAGSESSGSESGSSSSGSESSGNSGSTNNPGEITEGYFTYTVTDGKATIVNSTLAGDVTIPSELGGYPVTAIGDSLYHTCTPLRSIVLPDSITTIGDYAFYGCTSLTSITLPSSLASIGYKAFADCVLFTSIVVPNSVTSISNGAFSGCTSLTSIDVDENNSNYSSIDGVLFNKDRTELIQYPTGITAKTYTIPDSVASIDDWAFSSCTSLKLITIGKGVKTIGSYAFHHNSSLTDVYYKGSEEDWNAISIGSNNAVFDTATIYYNYLEDLSYYTYTVTDGNATITNVDSSISGDIIIPSELDGYPVTGIDDSAFGSCTLLTSIKIPDSISSISDSAFTGCKSLTSFKVDEDNTAYWSYSNALYNKTRTVLKRYPQGNTSIVWAVLEGVVSIADDAFVDCKSLHAVSIPSSVTYIGTSAFKGCSLSISGYSGSAAETYAAENNITFNAIS